MRPAATITLTTRSFVGAFQAWASAHRGKLGQLTPWKIDEKLKNENMQKRAVFYVYVIFLVQSGQAGVENGAMLTALLFRHTSECTIS